ncbi:MAG: aldose 1-epimerase family protein [Gaiellaceae bacterium]
MLPSGRQVELAAGDQRAVVVEVGGGLRTYCANGAELLDGYAEGAMCSSGRGQLLIPWPNRIEDGRYEFEGRTNQLPLSEVVLSNAIHGLVRWATWTVREEGSGRVVAEHVLHPQPGYPYTLALSVEYSLSDAGLRVQTTATNTGSEPCPYGAGAHPYLTVGTATVDPVVLRVPARTVILSDARALPVERRDVEGTPYDFRTPRTIGATVLDSAYADLDRDDDGLVRVELHDPGTGRGLTLWADETYGYLMVFSGDPLPDVARRSLAVEPMTCPANAFRTGEGLIRLEPGESFTSVWGLAPSGNPHARSAAAPM